MNTPLIVVGLLLLLNSSKAHRPKPTKPRPKPTKPKPTRPARTEKSWPVPGRRIPTAPIALFEYQRTPTHRHQGIDIGAPTGTPVVAAMAGTIVNSSNQWQKHFTGYGRHVLIKHEDGTYSLYAHLDSATANTGDTITAGQLIGTVGKTKFSGPGESNNLKSGPHLHFEIRTSRYPKNKESGRLDPVKWLTR